MEYKSEKDEQVSIKEYFENIRPISKQYDRQS